MTFLVNVASDPKALTARMRVGPPEPVELRKSVARLDHRAEGREIASEEVAALQKRIIDLAADGSLNRLSRRDIREGCRVILHGPTPLAGAPLVIDNLLQTVEKSNRRAAFFAAIDAYLDGFDSESANVVSLAEKLAAAASRWSWRPNDHWPQRLRKYSLLSPSTAPELIARQILQSKSSPREVLSAAGLDTGGRRFGGLVEAAFQSACKLVLKLEGQAAVDGQRVLIDWARDDSGKFGYQRSWPNFVMACLIPWEVVEPSEAHKSALIEMLERYGGGDPRARPQNWREVMDKAPGAYAVLMRWLTRASVLQFLDVVDRLMPDYEARKMWAYRRAFWTSYLLSDGHSPGIDAAWVAFGSDGARLANRAARESGDRSFAAFGRQNDKSPAHAALILEIGDLTIVDWSHNAKYQVWKRGEKRVPALFKEIYQHGTLYNAPINGSHLSPSTYTWQKRLAHIIEGRPIFSPKREWKPRNV